MGKGTTWVTNTPAPSGAQSLGQGVAADEGYGDELGVDADFFGPEDGVGDGGVGADEDDAFGVATAEVEDAGFDGGGIAGVESHGDGFHIAAGQGGEGAVVAGAAEGVVLVHYGDAPDAAVGGEPLYHFLGFLVVGSAHIDDIGQFSWSRRKAAPVKGAM